jgi:hypothetical protein
MFATHFNIPITNILGADYTGEPNDTKVPYWKTVFIKRYGDERCNRVVIK